MKVIIGGKIVTNGRIIEGKNIVFEDKILEISGKIPAGAEIIDAKGLYVSAGFIDRHVHGAAGHDVMDGRVGALDEISRALVQTGVTHFLPTTMTMRKERIVKAFETIRTVKGNESGAKIIGVHMEGPFINPHYKGAHVGDYIVHPDIEFIEEQLDLIKLITYAPELDEDLIFTESMKDYKEIILSIGHSDLDFDSALRINELGVKNITHCFNAMNVFHHRKPGIIGALFVKDFYVEYIADGIHSDIRMLRGFINRIGKEHAILISDAMRASLLEPGEFDLGGQRVVVDEVSARLSDGVLAGSILRMNQAVKNIISKEISLPEAIGMVTENPAKSLGLDEEIGTIEIGKDASFTLFDEEIEIKKVFVTGIDKTYKA